MNEEWQKFIAMHKDFLGYDCFCCFESFSTHAEKLQHLEEIHGYETLGTT